MKLSVSGGVGTAAWNPVNGATSYQVQTIIGGKSQVIGNTAQTQATIKSLPLNTQVGVQISACTGGAGSVSQVCGPWSNVQTISVGSPTTPPVVSGITITGSGTSRTVSWSAVSKPTGVTSVSYTFAHTDALGNIIQPGQQGYASFNGGQGDIETSSTSVTIGNLQYGTDLHFKVRACYNF